MRTDAESFAAMLFVSAPLRILDNHLDCKHKTKVDKILSLQGSQINILDVANNESLCVCYAFKIESDLTPDRNKWTFSLDGVVVDPGRTYLVSVFNLPEPDIEHYRIYKWITIPGSLWDPKMTGAVSVDEGHKMMTITVGFDTSECSERYKVSLQIPGFTNSEVVTKENRTSLDVTFDLEIWQLLECDMFFVVQPFFIWCKNDCLHCNKTFNYCIHYTKPPPRTLLVKAMMGMATVGDPANKTDVENKPTCIQVQERKRVLIIHSLDHPLYKNIVLKLSAFLVAKCGTEVVLDLLDSARLGMLGSVRWLDWHREQIEGSADKILILCSRGVQAKWRAMCGGKQVFLREDLHSLMGDMLTPALTLMVPDFVRSASFEKYIVAYFEDVCSEDDIPSPFNITVRYKLMKQFEELFFRILDVEKHRPGRENRIKGLEEHEYHYCPWGRALRDAIEAFHSYQLENPCWFEDELLKETQLEKGENLSMNSINHCMLDSPSQDPNFMKTKQCNFNAYAMGEQHQIPASFGFAEDTQGHVSHPAWHYGLDS
ncbi:interleukin-17 receptor A [Lampris incognitus]|uniref:interleukin-17 receptor A n=1 Tax=Lampris incognitus TaxID=2546036 RepID=UPI0024B634A3|nr:interleukin-17 receptor A [Lampris incognitus]